jgi:threonine aldolase
MAQAEVGDDVYGDDPTVNRLEEAAAKKLGKAAALFVPTGTMANQVSVMAHTRPGDEIIAGAHSHVIHYEQGGVARLSGVGAALFDPADGKIQPEDVARLTRPDNIHFPRTSLLCLENALSNGDVLPLETMKKVYAAAREHKLAIHLDGARIFNAAHALGCQAREIAALADSVSVCLSKGLCAPVGSMICGPAPFIEEARRCRKLLGGGMRQAGVLAACGLVALESMTERLQDDHANAQKLAKTLAAMDNVEVLAERVKINMVFWRSTRPLDDAALVAFMLKRNIKISGISGGWYRLVTHHDISAADVDTFAGAFREFAKG